MVTLSRVIGISLLTLDAFADSAAAAFVCRQLDVPGAARTRTWQLNDRGEVVAGSELGGYVYSGGAWSPLPAAPDGCSQVRSASTTRGRWRERRTTPPEHSAASPHCLHAR